MFTWCVYLLGMASQITWKIVPTKVSQLKEWKKNPRKLLDARIADLTKSIQKFGVAEPLVVNTCKTICGGHGRKKVLQQLGIDIVDCYYPSRPLTDKEFEELNIRLNKNNAGSWDYDILANQFDIAELIEWGFTETELNLSQIADDILELPKDEADKVNDSECVACPKCGFLVQTK